MVLFLMVYMCTNSIKKQQACYILHSFDAHVPRHQQLVQALMQQACINSSVMGSLLSATTLVLRISYQ